MLRYLLDRPASVAAVGRLRPFSGLGCRCVCLSGVATCHLLTGMIGSCIVTQLLLFTGGSLQGAYFCVNACKPAAAVTDDASSKCDGHIRSFVS